MELYILQIHLNKEYCYLQLHSMSLLCNCIEFQGLRVFHPLAVEMSVSIDGEKFENVGSIDTEKSQLQGKMKIKEYKLIFESKQARYIRVKAKNRGICPDWHPDEGQSAWLFMDEIIVK